MTFEFYLIYFGDRDLLLLPGLENTRTKMMFIGWFFKIFKLIFEVEKIPFWLLPVKELGCRCHWGFGDKMKYEILDRLKISVLALWLGCGTRNRWCVGRYGLYEKYVLQERLYIYIYIYNWLCYKGLCRIKDSNRDSRLFYKLNTYLTYVFYCLQYQQLLGQRGTFGITSSLKKFGLWDIKHVHVMAYEGENTLVSKDMLECLRRRMRNLMERYRWLNLKLWSGITSSPVKLWFHVRARVIVIVIECYLRWGYSYYDGE